jgi:hypothetical protein
VLPLRVRLQQVPTLLRWSEIDASSDSASELDLAHMDSTVAGFCSMATVANTPGGRAPTLVHPFTTALLHPRAPTLVHPPWLMREGAAPSGTAGIHCQLL